LSRRFRTRTGLAVVPLTFVCSPSVSFRERVYNMQCVGDAFANRTQLFKRRSRAFSCTARVYTNKIFRAARARVCVCACVRGRGRRHNARIVYWTEFLHPREPFYCFGNTSGNRRGFKYAIFYIITRKREEKTSKHPNGNNN